jgi:hypothetical protein
MSPYLVDLYYTKNVSIPTKHDQIMKAAEVMAEQWGMTPEEAFEKLMKSPFEEEPTVIEEAAEYKPPTEVKPPTPPTPELGAPVGRFPTTQKEMEYFQKNYIFDKGTKQWYYKP